MRCHRSLVLLLLLLLLRRRRSFRTGNAQIWRTIISREMIDTWLCSTKMGLCKIVILAFKMILNIEFNLYRSLRLKLCRIFVFLNLMAYISMEKMKKPLSKWMYLCHFRSLLPLYSIFLIKSRAIILTRVQSKAYTEPSSFSSLSNLPYSKDIHYFSQTRHIAE